MFLCRKEFGKKLDLEGKMFYEQIEIDKHIYLRTRQTCKEFYLPATLDAISHSEFLAFCYFLQL